MDGFFVTEQELVELEQRAYKAGKSDGSGLPIDSDMAKFEKAKSEARQRCLRMPSRLSYPANIAAHLVTCKSVASILSAVKGLVRSTGASVDGIDLVIREYSNCPISISG